MKGAKKVYVDPKVLRRQWFIRQAKQGGGIRWPIRPRVVNTPTQAATTEESVAIATPSVVIVEPKHVVYDLTSDQPFIYVDLTSDSE